MLKKGPQVKSESWFNTENISKSQIKFQFLWLYFGADFTHDSLGIRSWSFNRNCRLYEGLQFSFRMFSLMTNGLGEWGPSSNAVRPVRVHWNDATVARPAAGLHRRVAPRVTDGLTGQATSGLSSAIEAPARHREPPVPHFVSCLLPRHRVVVFEL